MQRRYMTAYIDPNTGRERLGTGGDAQAFHRYANVQNVIRFGLRKTGFPPGQYNVYAWPEGGTPRLVMTAHKEF